MKEGLAGALFSLTTNQWRADYGLESISRGSRLAKRTGESAKNFIGHDNPAREESETGGRH